MSETKDSWKRKYVFFFWLDYLNPKQYIFSPFLRVSVALSQIPPQRALVYNGQTTREKKTTRKRTKPGKVFEQKEGRRRLYILSKNGWRRRTKPRDGRRRRRRVWLCRIIESAAMREQREYHTHGETITSPVRATKTLLGLRLSVRFNDFKRTLERLWRREERG